MSAAKIVSKPSDVVMSEESALNAQAQADEPFETRAAFELYYKLGEQRSLERIAKQVGRHRTTIEDWSTKYRWQARLKERERQAAEYLIMQQSAAEEAETRKQHLTLIDAATSQWSKNLLSGSIKLEKVEDLDKLLKLRYRIASLPDKTANPTAVGGQSATIDLRLRNMDPDEMRKLLYETMQSIQRVMDKPRFGSRVGESGPEISLGVTVTGPAAPPREKTIEATVTTKKKDEDLDVSSFEADLDDVSLDSIDI